MIALVESMLLQIQRGDFGELNSALCEFLDLIEKELLPRPELQKWLLEFLPKMLRCQNDRDWIELGDLLELELMPVLREIRYP